ncbi:hypothetical protein COJ96_02450 [Bacillus sp. AFS073361]|nr:hypothetical protein COJ96_02450 [Bacillus sp. AFS073361]
MTMTIKLKICDDCDYLCSNSATKCQMCGSTNLVNGTFTPIKEPQKSDRNKFNNIIKEFNIKYEELNR